MNSLSANQQALLRMAAEALQTDRQRLCHVLLHELALSFACEDDAKGSTPAYPKCGDHACWFCSSRPSTPAFEVGDLVKVTHYGPHRDEIRSILAAIHENGRLWYVCRLLVNEGDIMKYAPEHLEKLGKKVVLGD